MRASRGLKWENKMYKLKRSIRWQSEEKQKQYVTSFFSIMSVPICRGGHQGASYIHLKLDQGHIDQHAELDQCVYDKLKSSSFTHRNFFYLGCIYFTCFIEVYYCGLPLTKLHFCNQDIISFYVMICVQSQLNEDNNNFTLSFI